MSKQPSRAGKTKPLKDTKGKPISTEKQPATLYEIVPGKFNENDWNTMLEIDDAQEFIWELIDEVFDNTIKIIYDNYLDKQRVPYTINEAKKAILHIIEWQFLSKDCNDDLTEVWLEDEDDTEIETFFQMKFAYIEPEACVIDSWAQGFVQAISTEPAELTADKNNEPNEAHNINEESLSCPIKADDNNSDSSTAKSLEVSEKPFLKLKPQIIKKEDNNILRTTKSKKIITNSEILLSRGSKSSLDLPNQQIVDKEKEEKQVNFRIKATPPEMKKLEESIAKAPIACQSVLKTLLSRPSAQREVEIDLAGNIESIIKLDREKFTSSNVKTRFAVVNENKSYLNYDLKKSKSTNSNINISDEKSKNVLIDEDSDIILEPAPGVVFTMLSSTRTGPKKTNVTTKQQVILEKSESFLKPVRNSDKFVSQFEMEQILGTLQTELLKKPNKLKTIPPINPTTSVN